MQGEPFEPQYEADRWLQAIAAQREIGRITSPTRGYLYRRGRLLVSEDVLSGQRSGSGAVGRLLREARAERAGDKESETAGRLGLGLLRVDDQVAAPSLVRDARRAAVASASLEHVFVGNPRRYFGCDPAEPADAPDLPGKGSAGEGKTVAILDTGIWPANRWPQVDAGPDDEDVPDDDGDQLLDAPAGHGTFIAGVILRYAPQTRILARKVLHTAAGLGSELDIAKAILDLPEVDVINCSFGGPTQNDDSPLTIERAIARLPRKTIVVAAGGNAGDERPQWPAASNRVVGVGWAEDPNATGQWALSPDSSFGPWLDASAPGSDIVSAFVDFDESAGSPSAGVLPRTFKGGALWSGSSFAAPAVVATIVALSSRDGISVREAAFRLIWDPTRPQVADGGTLVLPDQLP